MTPIKLELADPAFFAANPKRLKVEENPGTGRTYFILKDRIVAVGLPTRGDAPQHEECLR